MPELSADELIRQAEEIEAKAAASTQGAAAPDDLAVQIWDEFIKTVVPETGREIAIPKPTLAMIQLYQSRRPYFEDPRHGLGRLLWALTRQRDRDVMTALRLGGDANEGEAAALAANVLSEEVGPYYILFFEAARYGAESSKKKVATYLSTPKRR